MVSLVKENPIYVSYHHSFAGGSKIASRLLHLAAENGHDINAFFFEHPQFFNYTNTNIKINILNSVNNVSDVVSFDSLKNLILTNQIVEEARNNIQPILFAANLFPYGNIMLDVKSQIGLSHNILSNLILQPVGSDIWQIGPKIRSRVKYLLDNPNVNTIITYSISFIDEIKEYYDIEKKIEVLPPVLEPSRFFAIDKEQKNDRRKELGFYGDDFIIHHHSSMRRIKSPEIVLNIAINAAQLIKTRCVLIMVGPVPYDIINDMQLGLLKEPINKMAHYRSVIGNLTILWTGILLEVEYLLQIADVEINASLHDSFNVSLMEALACGVPVITSDIVGINEHIIASESGFSFPTKRLKFDELNDCLNSKGKKSTLFDLDYAIQSVVTLAKNRALGEEMGHRGAYYTAEHFSFKKIGPLFFKYLNQ